VAVTGLALLYPALARSRSLLATMDIAVGDCGLDMLLRIVVSPATHHDLERIML
jgi:hypothetical protein